MIEFEIAVRFVKSLNFTNLDNFGESWGENDASWKVDHGNQCCLNEISDNFYFDYKAVKLNQTELFLKNLMNKMKIMIFNFMAILSHFQMLHHP